jgi:DNA-binding PadR family transcriptional regulator
MPEETPVEDLLPLTDLAFNVLVALADEPQHGYALLKELRTRTGRRKLRTGTVYAALARLQDDGLVQEVPDAERDDDPRRRYYRTTELGLRTARAEAVRLAEVLQAASAKRLLPARDRA